MLELRDICFSPQDAGDDKQILDHVNLKLEDNKLVVVTGPNGSGKSTLVKIIAGIEKPDSGQIILNGKDITQEGITERARMGMSFAFQQPVRFQGITVLDFLRMAARKDLSTNDACNILSQVGLCARDYVKRDLDDSLSGGEIKRIEIAASMVQAASLSLFDEPEAGIDLWSFRNLIQVFEDLKKKLSGTILIISHQERILNIADEIVLIRDGKIAAQGTKDQVMPLLSGHEDVCNCKNRQQIQGMEVY